MSRMILLADDSITIQKIVNLTFSGEGIDVLTVGNGDAALKKIREHRPSLVLADIFMPGKNGYEVCEAIKNDPGLQTIPVILLVGAFEPFDGQEASRVKADSHLTKPFEIKALISAVRTLIEAAEQQTTPSTEIDVSARAESMDTETTTEPVTTRVASEETVESPSESDIPLSSATEEEIPVVTHQEVAEPVLASLPQQEVSPWSRHEEAAVERQPVEDSVSEAAAPVIPDGDSSYAAVAKVEEKVVPAIEETDPLGLEIAEDNLALASASHSQESDGKSLFVDIWESADAPAFGAQPSFVESSPRISSSAEVESKIQETVRTAELEPESTPEPVPPTLEMSPAFVIPPVAAAVMVPDIAEPSPSATSGSSLTLSLEAPETEELIERIANKVVEKLSREVIERIGWEVIPDLASLMIKDQVETHFKTTNER
ncbi:MAG: response regulator [Terriglobia bacterium]